MPKKNFAIGSRIREKKKKNPREGKIVSTDPSQEGKRLKWLVLFDGEEEPVPRSSQQLLSIESESNNSPSNNATFIENKESDEGASVSNEDEEDDLDFFPAPNSSFSSDLEDPDPDSEEHLGNEGVQELDPDSEENEDFSTEVESNLYVPNSSSNDFEEE